MVEIDGEFYDKEDEAIEAVKAQFKDYRRSQADLTLIEQRAREAGQKTGLLLRERAPKILKRRLVSLPVLKSHELTIKDIVEEMGESVRYLMMAVGPKRWPARISTEAEREILDWVREIGRKKG